MVNDERVLSVDQLPDDPLQMPPPYWRYSGAIFQIPNALGEMDELLRELIPVHVACDIRLDEHYQRYPDDNSDEAMDDFSEITDPVAVLEHKIRMKSEIVCLMSAIQAEETLNAFCVFNLHRNIAESIEKLSATEKLVIASTIAGSAEVRGSVPYEAMQKLMKWRNAFAHGHCVDRPTKSLRHNHLIAPDTYIGTKASVTAAIEMAEALLEVESYLCSISVNPYIRQSSAEFSEIEMLVEQLHQYRIEGDEFLFEITLLEDDCSTQSQS